MINLNIPIWVLIIVSIFACGGFLIFCEFIYCLIKTVQNFRAQQKEFKMFANELKESGFLNEISKEITDEERKKLESEGKAGTKINFNLKTKKVTVENIESKSDPVVVPVSNGEKLFEPKDNIKHKSSNNHIKNIEDLERDGRR